MSTNGVCVKLEEKGLIAALQQARAQLSNGEGEVALDFSAVHRIDTSALKALEELAAAAQEKGGKVALRGVNVEIYKVLKVARVATRFIFQN